MNLIDKIRAQDAQIAVIGLGYVGLPLALAAADTGFTVTGFDIDPEKIATLNDGQSYISHIGADVIAAAKESRQFNVTTKFAGLERMDVILICVPTPLTTQREPDMTFVTRTTEQVAMHLKQDQLVILESTTYPGTTTELVRPILEQNGLTSGQDFFLAYSPEREDPGNSEYSTKRIPKVVSGDGGDALALALSFYEQLVPAVVPVSTIKTAEAAKLTENIFRAVNIALVNELKLIFDAMEMDVWEVIEAAKTKPFGYMPFYPGPGLGGHCIPIDPFYLAWKAREYDVSARFIELAGEVNAAMPRYVVQRLSEGLSDRFGLSLKEARVLVVGVAYKKNVDDTRGSASFRIMRLLKNRGAEVSYYDPFVPAIGKTRDYPDLVGMESMPWNPESLDDFAAVLILADHDCVDYQTLVERSSLVLDTRNVISRLSIKSHNVLKA